SENISMPGSAHVLRNELCRRLVIARYEIRPIALILELVPAVVLHAETVFENTENLDAEHGNRVHRGFLNCHVYLGMGKDEFCTRRCPDRRCEHVRRENALEVTHDETLSVNAVVSHKGPIMKPLAAQWLRVLSTE